MASARSKLTTSIPARTRDPSDLGLIDEAGWARREHQLGRGHLPCLSPTVVGQGWADCVTVLKHQFKKAALQL